MRIAVFSDVHGNPYACEAVLEAIDDDGPFDEVVVAGDVSLYGSAPAACIDMLRMAGVTGVYGNSDQYIYAPHIPPTDELHLSQWYDWTLPIVHWTRDQLGQERIDWLEAMPFERRFSPTGNPNDDLLIVHANPKNIELMIYPSPDRQQQLWGEVRQPDDSPALMEVMEGVEAQVVAFGHFHYNFVRRWNDQMLVNVSPAGVPLIDFDPRARYTIFTWCAGRWCIIPKYIAYDFSKELEALQVSSMPDAKNISRIYDNPKTWQQDPTRINRPLTHYCYAPEAYCYELFRKSRTTRARREMPSFSASGVMAQ